MAEGFSHVGLSTHDMEATIRFYSRTLRFACKADEKIHIREGGTMRQVSFDVGDGQYLVFMEAKGVRGIPDNYDTGINGALGVPAGMYHVALRVSTLDALEQRRSELVNLGVDTSSVIDLGHARSIFFHDPNGIQLEISCPVRAFDETDLGRESEASIA
ncbi:VOC family protein [Variovorax sp. dw_308]|uniref:VOC family protein n=1 Tax=Variovorax sp. dw_308 TaxID=2721546 RepID=UPI001C47C5B5|nr:VOC family protein [Variovorax sp. dw_308]